LIQINGKKNSKIEGELIITENLGDFQINGKIGRELAKVKNSILIFTLFKVHTNLGRGFIYYFFSSFIIIF
jgi:hypothetical protein